MATKSLSDLDASQETTTPDDADFVYLEQAGSPKRISRSNFFKRPSVTDGNLAQWDSDGVAVDGPNLTTTLDARQFTSAAQTITAGGLLTIAHGLASAPKTVMARMICNDAGGDGGYAQNDVIHLGPGSNGSAAANGGFAVYSDATNVYVRFFSSSGAITYLNKSTGAMVALTDSKWDFYIEARI